MHGGVDKRFPQLGRGCSSPRDGAGNWIDYHAAVSSSLRLIPDGEARSALARDYERMVDERLLFDEAEPFDALMASCVIIEYDANAVGR